MTYRALLSRSRALVAQAWDCEAVPCAPGQACNTVNGSTRCSPCAKETAWAIQKGTRVLISLWDSLMFGRVLEY